MLSVRCKLCNKELKAYDNKTHMCGCPNMTTITCDKVTAKDLNEVVLLNSVESVNKRGLLSSKHLEFQENRRKRKVRKLDFEER